MPTIYYILISILLNVCGQLSIKWGTNTSGALKLGAGDLIPTLGKIITNPYIVGGLLFYAISAVFWIVALSKTDLSYAYPFLSLGYILIVILSAVILHENITLYRLAGIACIIVGLILIARR